MQELVISIHTPLAGSDPADLTVSQWAEQFQSTLPLRGATQRGEDLLRPHRISIHAPLAGSDAASSVTIGMTVYFNPHSPCGERPGGSDGQPVGGAISIHTPLAGSDPAGRRSPSTTSNFNPRSPCGERRSQLRDHRHDSLFQSTLPLRGATGAGFSMFLGDVKFQSTLPLRGATKCPEYIMAKLRISIHAPLAGSDGVEVAQTVVLANISIHAPLAGSDAGAELMVYSETRFQSTLPLRGATRQHDCRYRRHADFNPRSPCGERR